MIWRKSKIFLSLLLIIAIMFVSYLSKNQSVKTMGDVIELPIYSVDRKDKVVSLTFDINWAETEYLYDILDTLDKYNIKGTFFIMGAWVEYSQENVDKLKAINERGHEIGNHSYKHVDFTQVSESKVDEELRKTDEIVKKYTGKKIKLFRFPSGSYNKQSYRMVVSRGYIPIQWNVDSVDWKQEGEEIEYNNVINKVSNGSIILFHNNAKYTPKNLENIIKELICRGYKFTKVSQMLYSEETYIDQNGKQFGKN